MNGLGYLEVNQLAHPQLMAPKMLLALLIHQVDYLAQLVGPQRMAIFGFLVAQVILQLQRLITTYGNLIQAIAPGHLDRAPVRQVLATVQMSRELMRFRV